MPKVEVSRVDDLVILRVEDEDGEMTALVALESGEAFGVADEIRRIVKEISLPGGTKYRLPDKINGGD
jgi:hypothetical protein